MLTDDFLSDARKRMVDSQLRPNRVSDPRILEAMRHLPRERFLPADLADQAYADQNVALGMGRVLLQPMLLARMAQAAEPIKGEKILIVAAGTGYAAALFAAAGCAVVALEAAGPLADQAASALASVAPAVELVTGPLTAGWQPGAPYDIILIDGAVPEIPAALAAQLNRDTGRLVTIVNGGAHTGHAIQAEPTQTGLSVRALFDAQCPVIPAFAAAPVFAF